MAELFQGFAGGVVEAVIKHFEKVSLAEIFQAVGFSLLDELGEVVRVADFREFVVEQVALFVAEDVRQFRLDPLAVFVLGVLCVRKKLNEGLRLPDPLLRRRQPAHMKEHHLAQHGAQMRAGQGVVADEGDAMRSQMLAAQRQHRFANLRRHPGKKSVRKDVIKFSLVGGELSDAAMHQRHILQAEFADGLLTLGNGLGGEVNADKFALRKPARHRNEIAAVAATEFQHAAAADRRGFKAEEQPDHRQPVGVGLRMRVTRIGDHVVAGGWVGHGVQNCSRFAVRRRR